MRAWAVLALMAATAQAAPRADVVVSWVPGHAVGPLADAVREAGAALIDRTPAPPAHSELPALIARGVAAYDALRFDDAWSALEAARALADRTGAAGASRTQLGDLFIYRGLVRAQRGDDGWDELVAAMAIDPARVLDPARFPPPVIAELERARAAVAAAPRVHLAITAPAGCAITVDGGPPPPDLPRAAHWLAASCPDRGPWGARVDVVADAAITALPPALAPPDDGELLVQARTAGARGVVVVEARGELALLRLLSADGRERTRRTTRWADAPAALRELLAGAPSHPWYASRWAWAAGAALVAAAILVPITAAIASDRAPASGTLHLGVPF